MRIVLSLVVLVAVWERQVVFARMKNSHTTESQSDAHVNTNESQAIPKPNNEYMLAYPYIPVNKSTAAPNTKATTPSGTTTPDTLSVPSTDPMSATPTDHKSHTNRTDSTHFPDKNTLRNTPEVTGNKAGSSSTGSDVSKPPKTAKVSQIPKRSHTANVPPTPIPYTHGHRNAVTIPTSKNDSSHHKGVSKAPEATMGSEFTKNSYTTKVPSTHVSSPQGAFTIPASKEGSSHNNMSGVSEVPKKSHTRVNSSQVHNRSQTSRISSTSPEKRLDENNNATQAVGELMKNLDTLTGLYTKIPMAFGLLSDADGRSSGGDDRDEPQNPLEELNTCALRMRVGNDRGFVTVIVAAEDEERMRSPSSFYQISDTYPDKHRTFSSFCSNRNETYLTFNPLAKKAA